MEPRSIVDVRLFVGHSGGDPPMPMNSRFAAQPPNRAHLASQLLLYDTLVLPTSDFGVIPILIDWMGIERSEAAPSKTEVGGDPPRRWP